MDRTSPPTEPMIMPEKKNHSLQVDPLVLQEIGRLSMELAVAQRRVANLSEELRKTRAALDEHQNESGGEDAADA